MLLKALIYFVISNKEEINHVVNIILCNDTN